MLLPFLTILTLVLFHPFLKSAQYLDWAYAFCLTWMLSSFLTPLAIRLSFIFKWLDIPKGRKAHFSPTPLLGGCAIVISFTLGLAATGQLAGPIVGVLIGGYLLWITGMIDDRWSLSAKLKLFIQVLAVLVLFFFDIHVELMGPTWWGRSMEYIITALWVIGLTNAVNFLDGMDGLAAGMSGIISVFLAIVALQTNQIYFAYAALCMMGACLGFLPYNFRKNNPALCFLGDGGSTFLGFTLASIVIIGDWAEHNTATLVVPILLMSVPIFDMTMTTIVRIYTGQVRSFGEWLAYTGRDHLHHRLAALGIGRFRAVLIIYAVTTITCISAIVLKQARGIDAILILVQVTLLFLLISYFMISVRSKQIRLLASAFVNDPAPPQTSMPVYEQQLDEILRAADYRDQIGLTKQTHHASQQSL